MSVADFTRAIEQCPDTAFIYGNRGDVLINLKKYDRALLDYNKALRLDSTYVATINNRGMLYDLMGENELAIIDFSKSIELDSVMAAYSLNNRANCYRKLKQFEKAKMDVERSIELDENNGWAYATLAFIFADEGNDELFFKNIEFAISKSLAYPLKEKWEGEKSLGKYKDDERFLKILDKSEG